MTDLSNLRIFVCTSPINMNLSFNRLMDVAQQTFDQDPLSGHLFLFFNRQRDSRSRFCSGTSTVFARNNYRLQPLPSLIDRRLQLLVQAA